MLFEFTIYLAGRAITLRLRLATILLLVVAIALVGGTPHQILQLMGKAL